MEINLNIKSGNINNDEMLITYSEINTSSPKQYADIINFNLQQLFKNNSNFTHNITKLEKEINSIKNKIEFYYLDKFSKKINKKWLDDPKKINNFCICIKLEKSINGYNTICFFCDIEKKKRENTILGNNNWADELFFYIKRIEILDQNFNCENFKDNSININSSSESVSTSFYSIENEILNVEKFFDDEDYDGDTLKIKDWTIFLELVNDYFQKDKNNSENLTNEFFIFDSKIFLASKNEWKKSNKEYTITKDLEPLNEYQVEEWPKFINCGDKFIDKLVEVIEENLKKIDIYNDENKNLKNTINAKEIELNNIENVIKNKKYELDGLVVFSKTLDSNIDENKKEINDNKNKIKQLEQEISQLKQQQYELNNNINKLKNNIDERNDWISDFKKENKYISSWKEYFLSNKYKYFYQIDGEFKFKDSNNKIDNKLFDISMGNVSANEKYSIVELNIATAAKFKRYNFAMKQLNKGFYKNFSLFQAIKNPNPIINKTKLDLNIKNKYNLNKKQNKAVEKAINTNDIFYLQGPPGTGKTQTLCAICDSVINRNQNIVMCSSTHEAIDNFLERLQYMNIDNPNLIIFKYRFDNANKNKQFNEENLYRNFKDAILNFISNKSDKNNLDLLNEYKQKYNNDLPVVFNKKLPKSYLNLISNNLDFFNKPENQKLIKNDEDNEFIFPLDEIYDDVIDYEKIENANYRLNRFYNDRIDKDPNSKEQVDLFDKSISSINIEINSFNFPKNTKLNQINFLESYQHKTDNDLQIKINKIRDFYQSKTDEYEDEFLNYIMKNNLINVIGITTTSRQSFEIAKIKKNLFSDYSIDLILIDEISKSSTPEILSKIILGKKIILSGDYMQLPPISEFSSEPEIENLINWIMSKKEKDPNSKIIKNANELFKLNECANDWENLNESKKDQFIKLIKNIIEQLFRNSFFVRQIEKIKSSNNNLNSSYEFLQESHRFSGKIIELVNHVYDEEEKLTQINPIKNFYNLKINGKNLHSELVIVDTSKFDSNFFSKYHEFNISNISNFDQTGSCFKLKNYPNFQYNGSSCYNQYSAIVIIELVRKIISDHSNCLNDKKIGIITLTKSQKNIMQKYSNIFLKEYKEFIKIDTIDNFQGREEEIIIVDFIRGRNKIDNQKLVITKKRNYSFLAEVERINVAISRAK